MVSHGRQLFADFEEEERGRENPECRYCRRAFYNRSSLRRHMQRHLDKNRERFPCHICFKQFARKDYVREHRMNVHGLDN